MTSGPGTGESLASLIQQGLNGYSDTPVIASEEGQVDSHEIQLQIQSWRREFVARGTQRGDRIAIGLPNSVAFVATALAALELGAVIIPLRPETLERTLPQVADELLPRIVLYLAEGRSEVFPLGSVRAETDPNVNLFSPDRVEPMPPGDGSDADPGGIFFTSGSTGVAKPVPLSRAALAESYFAYHRLMQDFSFDGIEAAEQDRLITAMAAPRHFTAIAFASITGWTCIGRALFFSTTLVTQPRFHPRRALELIERFRVTNAVFVPPMLELILREVARKTYDVSALTVVGVGGAPLPPEIARRAENELGAYVVIGYGSTETAGGVTSTRLNDPPDTRHSTVGRSLPGTAVAVVGDHGVPVSDGSVGELIYRGPVHPDLAKGADGTVETWYRTGDLATVDSAGFVRIVGRVDDLINVGGYKIQPEVIEAVLQEDHSICAAIVVGEPQEGRAAHRLVAYLVLQPGEALEPERLFANCRARLGAQAVPTVYRVIEAVPTTLDGKVSRAAVRQPDNPVSSDPLRPCRRFPIESSEG